MSTDETQPKSLSSPFKQHLRRIVFEAETPAGKFYDIALLWVIGLSVAVVMLESVQSINAEWHHELCVAEWFFTVVFIIEYFTRIWLVRRKQRYIFSFFGIVDFLSWLPTCLTLLIPGTRAQSLLIIRVLRLLRIFRVLKMAQHIRGADTIITALRASRPKITVFFFSMAIFAILIGTLLYFIESGQPGTSFTNIPVSIYYTIITITTIGFGDITAQTPLGMSVSALAGLTGYAVMAVPTGIITAGIYEGRANRPDESTKACPGCGTHGHLLDATFCRHCGEELDR